MPESLRTLAQSLDQHSLRLEHFGFDDDDDDDGDEDDDDWGDDEPLFGGPFGEMNGDAVIRSMPKEMIAAFMDDPKAVEQVLRSTLPRGIVDVVLAALQRLRKKR